MVLCHHPGPSHCPLSPWIIALASWLVSLHSLLRSSNRQAVSTIILWVNRLEHSLQLQTFQWFELSHSLSLKSQLFHLDL